MKIYILFIFVLIANIASAQYCGNAGAAICSTDTSLNAPGITDYTTFPCVHDSVPYSQVIQVFFPDSISEFGLWVHIQAIHVDSVTNLPCGLCWSCNSDSLGYLGGSKACMLISGTTNDKHGAYELYMYGTAYTDLGILSGSLSTLGYQFFLNVVGQNDACSPINITALNTACDTSVVVASGNCNLNVQLSSTGPTTGCVFNTATVTVIQPVGPQYSYNWLTDSFPPTIITGPSLQLTAGGGVALIVYDSIQQCSQFLSIPVDSQVGPYVVPSICYNTSDTSLAVDTGITFVFQKNNLNNTLARYTLQRQDTIGAGALTPVTSIADTAMGIITDPRPLDWMTIHTTNFLWYQYSIDAETRCGTDVGWGNWFSPLVSYTDTLFTGYPRVVWQNGHPAFYDDVYVYSRYPGGSWRLRYSSNNLNDSVWIDQAPDSTVMQYVVGVHLTVSCDPSRSTTMAFSNFGTTAVSPNYVVHDTSVATGINTLKVQDVIVYPNPTGEKLYIQLPTNIQSEVDYKIYDVTGRLITTALLTNHQLSVIHVANFSAGVYLLELKAGNELNTVKRFVKK